MNKKKTSIKLLTAALIVNGIYLLILVLMTCFQKWIKTSVQNAPLGARTTFYFPYDDVIFAAVCLVLMLAISLVLISRIKAGAKTGTLPVCGMVFFGVLVPYLSKIASHLESLRIADSQAATEESINYVMSASYVHDLTAWALPLFFVSAAVFVAGCAVSLCARE